MAQITLTFRFPAVELVYSMAAVHSGALLLMDGVIDTVAFQAETNVANYLVNYKAAVTGALIGSRMLKIPLLTINR